MPTIYTIGHSNHSIESFIAMLHSFGIKLLADVRTMPGSAWNPQFNRMALELALNDRGIKYLHMPDLGGKNKVGYPDYMATAPFQKAIQLLMQQASAGPVAYMCAEADWQHCHRRYISDYLKSSAWQVMHITGAATSTAHTFTPPPLPKQGELFYV